MKHSLVCLTLCEDTLQKNASLVEKYRRYIDIAELRVDFLSDEEQLHIRKFPTMIDIPCILTIRRQADGGRFVNSEISRTMLFGRALAFTDKTISKKFAYVDFENDYAVSSLQDAALAFDIKIIRSLHSMNEPVKNLKSAFNELRKTEYEIPKIAFMPKTMEDITNVFEEASSITEGEHILCAMGALGQITRILAPKLNSFLTYTSPIETNHLLPQLGHIDPVTLHEVYNFKNISEKTSIYGVAGWPLVKTASPELHNTGYKNHSLDCVFVPIRAPSVQEVFSFANKINVQGLAVTVPFKEDVISRIHSYDDDVEKIGACNTVWKRNGKWEGFNTDAYGFKRSLINFLGTEKLKKQKVAIVGAGGAAKAIAYVIKQMNGKACIFNRTIGKAKAIADMYNFDYASLGPESTKKLIHFSDIIIQTTSKGMNSTGKSTYENDPIFFYQFHGHEKVFDIIYTPETTPIMERAKEAGCEVCNGKEMLKYQGYKQFKIFTGKEYEV